MVSKHIKRIIANGCSHTSGAEMEYAFQNCCYERAWPRWVADDLGCEWVNLAQSGASAKRNLRTTMWYFGCFPAHAKDSLVIINWPGPWRYELRLDRVYNRNIPDSTGERIDSRNWWQFNGGEGNAEAYAAQVKKGVLRRSEFEFFRHCVTTTTDDQMWLDYAMHILALQNYLKCMKIPYLFYNSTTAFGHLLSDPFTRQIDTRYWIGNPGSYEEGYFKRCEGQGFNFAEPSVYNHFGEDAHQWWASVVKQEILQKYPKLQFN